jgi:anti-anti-sigma factor
MASQPAKFALNDGCLRVLVDVDHHLVNAFKDANELLVKEPLDSLVIDLTKVNFICSSGLGELIRARDAADKLSKSIKIIIPKKLESIFNIMSFQELMDIEVENSP